MDERVTPHYPVSTQQGHIAMDDMVQASLQMAQFVTDNVDNVEAGKLEAKIWKLCAGKKYATICAALAATTAHLRQDFMDHSEGDEAAANMAAGAVFVLARGIWEQAQLSRERMQ